MLAGCMLLSTVYGASRASASMPYCGLRVEQSGPSHPWSHTQQPWASLQLPWPEQPTGQMRCEQSAPSHPASHLHTPWSHVPLPEQSFGHRPTLQSSPE